MYVDISLKQDFDKVDCSRQITKNVWNVCVATKSPNSVWQWQIIREIYGSQKKRTQVIFEPYANERAWWEMRKAQKMKFKSEKALSLKLLRFVQFLDAIGRQSAFNMSNFT
jgi:hypothetical protein